MAFYGNHVDEIGGNSFFLHDSRQDRQITVCALYGKNGVDMAERHG